MPLGHLITGVAPCLTIIGIPLGLANLKLIPVALLPFGRDIVSVEQTRAMGMDAVRLASAGPQGSCPDRAERRLGAACSRLAVTRAGAAARPGARRS
jgi:hypothetical protein